MNAFFASDNVTSACPEVMDAVIAANSGIADATYLGTPAKRIARHTLIQTESQTPMRKPEKQS